MFHLKSEFFNLKLFLTTKVLNFYNDNDKKFQWNKINRLKKNLNKSRKSVRKSFIPLEVPLMKI